MESRTDLIVKEELKLSRLCQSFYFMLRNNTSFTWFRSNFFYRYQSYQEIQQHAKDKPNSRTAISFELATKINEFDSFKKFYNMTKEIKLSAAAKEILANNKKFLNAIQQIYPDFIYALVDQQDIPPPPFFKRISVPTTDNHTEANPYISNFSL